LNSHRCPELGQTPLKGAETGYRLDERSVGAGIVGITWRPLPVISQDELQGGIHIGSGYRALGIHRLFLMSGYHGNVELQYSAVVQYDAVDGFDNSPFF
jgi:hypothetical protein